MNRRLERRESFGTLVYDRANHSMEITALNGVPRASDRVLSAPLRVFLVITRRCNLECSYCSSQSGRGRTDRMEYEFVEDLLGQLAEMNVPEIALNGGEPLAHPDFFRIVECARGLGLCTYLNTNGVMSTAQLHRLAGAGVDKIKISIDGMRESNDAYRGQGNFDRAMQTARFLSNAGQHVRINAVLSRRSVADMLDLVRSAEECGCGLKIAPMVKVGRGHELTEEAFTLAEIRELSNALEQFCARERIQQHIEFCTGLIEELAQGGPGLDAHGKSMQQHLECCNRYLHTTVDTCGSVYATGQQVDLERVHPAGNALTTRFQTIWANITRHNEAIRQADRVCRACPFASNLIQVIRATGARSSEVWHSDLAAISFGPRKDV